MRKEPFYISKDQYMQLEAEGRLDKFAEQFKNNDIIVYTGKLARFDELKNKQYKI